MVIMNYEAIQRAFEKMTGVADAWTNPALMQARNGFIAGWELAMADLEKQEPVAWMDAQQPWDLYKNKPQVDAIPLYTSPQPRKWVGLTEKDRLYLGDLSAQPGWDNHIGASQTEDLLRRKNNGY
jgi:hypothetical protein